MGESHVFVTRGSLTNFACDAWLLPTDRTYSIAGYWREALPGLEAVLASSRDVDFSSGAKLAQPLDSWPAGEPMPVLTAVPYYGISSVEDLVPPLREFVRVAAEQVGRRQRAAGGKPSRPVPLLAMPLFGTSGGGAGLVRGDVIQRLLQEARRAAAESGVDVALILTNDKDFAFAQELRKRQPDWWKPLDRELQDHAARLAAHARDGKLVPFMGAGVSMSAGAPSWDELLARLATAAQLSGDESESLKKRGHLDQAGILRSIYEERSDAGGRSFNQAIADLVELKRYGLAPALLASLGSREAITLNYDELFEFASADAGVPRSVIPDGGGENDDWLLKLHGSVTNPDSIVLTRDDYLGFNASRNALSALVKATLMTQHILFVGFGLADDHFHEILHDVKRALPPEPRGKDGSATALMLSADPLDRRMVSQLNLVPMNEESGTAAGRTLEIFLDLLVALSTDSHSYLLAEGYEGALTESERSLRETLLDLTKRLTDDEAQSSGGVRLQEMLAELGASAPSSCTP
ncbi:SIR2 family protein [Arthrobacter sp. zg-Y1110]|uniref:SIR2 family NAD-dependent protein deacylase n=1 Tax=Arthrobacter sp. zg-Y1110 TaxID=2886932 RepID=UPI001D150614|nr:SIR2 family protein [Arthrobacter sp. zg-Y1110]MCC3291765.1 SIR2 family protein [Arthrobacter sp. zg-Y1110]UWX85600.1 SIR2 family protein [Arthrobacter sp. zg-Y1110]